MENTINETTNANTTAQTVEKNTNNIMNYITPIAIVVAGIIIALALYTRGDVSKNSNKDIVNGALSGPKPEFTDVKSIDHIRGSKDAEIVIIEYSDMECPFCKQYHTTMKNIYSEFKDTGKVAWVYRHFPISYGENARHPNAAKKAEASECAAEIGGSDMFWSYTDAIYENTSNTGQLAMEELPKLAVKVGLDEVKFTECLNSGKYADKVKASYEEALKAGAQGTPYTIIRYKNDFIPLVDETGAGLGSLPQSIMSQIIKDLLNQTK